MTSEYPSNAPQLGSIPTLDDVNVPNSQSASNGSTTAQSAKDSFAASEVRYRRRRRSIL